MHLYSDRSFTVLHALGVLAQFNVFFFSLNSWSSVTGAWVEAGCGRQGSWLGVAGRARGWVVERSCYLGLGSAAPVPGFLDTQPPCATRAFKILSVAAKLA